MPTFDTNAYDPRLNRRDISVSPVQAPTPYSSNFASELLSTIAGDARGYYDARSQAKVRDAQAGLYGAQRDGQVLDNTKTQRELDGYDEVARIIARAQTDKEFGDQFGTALAAAAAKGILDPKKVASFVQLGAANSKEPAYGTQDNIGILTRNQAPAGNDPLRPGESFDPNVAQGNFQTQDATKQRGQDRNFEASTTNAQTQAGATIRAAEIAADARKSIAASKQDDPDAASKPRNQNVNRKDASAYVLRALNSKVPKAASKKGIFKGVNGGFSPEIKNETLRRFEEKIAAGTTPTEAAAQAADEVLDGTYKEAPGVPGFRVGAPRVGVNKGILSRDGAAPPAAKTAPKPAQKPAASGGLKPGANVDGYIYRGGNPNDASSWSPAGA